MTDKPKPLSAEDVARALRAIGWQEAGWPDDLRDIHRHIDALGARIGELEEEAEEQGRIYQDVGRELFKAVKRAEEVEVRLKEACADRNGWESCAMEQQGMRQAAEQREAEALAALERVSGLLRDIDAAAAAGYPDNIRAWAREALDAIAAPGGRAEALRADRERVWNEAADWADAAKLWFERKNRREGEIGRVIREANPYARTDDNEGGGS